MQLSQSQITLFDELKSFRGFSLWRNFCLELSQNQQLEPPNDFEVLVSLAFETISRLEEQEAATQLGFTESLAVRLTASRREEIQRIAALAEISEADLLARVLSPSILNSVAPVRN